ncbi:hypothetical protein PPERSA_07678 [Pseudocohnilembus persalinus]|uniref:Uncharacterized protein n=1 Tax=Pseudocohnilembus persalinus TaxID=266149 RepID=A0A0V0QIA3_PSEPJ|nr:hypothetical protein PPERSA_07678 [Pseudocohnilembus persalinus]|eukprot:KRX02033.1 hypothetical protein PPERSA_07678 [Pseudocohnilembus persalinus]
MSSFGKIKKGDIFQGNEFSDYPYQPNNKYDVYLPKQQNSITQLIQRDRLKTSQNQRQNLQPLNQERPQSSKMNPEQRTQQNFRQNKSVFKGQQEEQVNLQSRQNSGINSQQQLQQSQSQQNLNGKLQNSGSFYRTSQQFGRSYYDKNDPRRYEYDGSQYCQSVNHHHGHHYMRPLLNPYSNLQLNKKKWTPKSSGYTQKQDELRKTQTKLRSKLYYDEQTMSVPKTTLKNQVIENIVQDPNVFLKNKSLLDSVYKLKQNNMLKQHKVHINAQTGIGKFDFIDKNVHSKSTNNGFSRNDFGGYFTR